MVRFVKEYSGKLFRELEEKELTAERADHIIVLIINTVRGDEAMNENELLQAIGQIVDEKISASEQKLIAALAQQGRELRAEMAQQTAELRAEMAQQTAELRAEMDQREQRILEEGRNNMLVLIESEITPKFNLLADGQQEIRDMMIPRSRFEDLEEEVRFMKTIIRQMTEDIAKLKKAQ